MSSERGDPWTIRIATATDAESISNIHEDAWRTLYRPLLPHAVVAAHAPQRTIDAWLDQVGDPSVSLFVAENRAAGIDGFMCVGATRLDADASFDREITHFYLRNEVRRQGLGREMIDKVLHRLASDGACSVVVRVMDGNPFAPFYEAVGASCHGKRDIVLYGHRIVEIVYAWWDIEGSRVVHNQTAGEAT